MTDGYLNKGTALVIELFGVVDVLWSTHDVRDILAFARIETVC